MNGTRAGSPLILVALLPLVTGACSPRGGSLADPFEAPRDAEPGMFILAVHNPGTQDARVEIVWGADSRVLGTVRAGERDSFRLPVRGSSFRLAVEYVDAGRGFETAPFTVRSGQLLRFQVPGNPGDD